MKNILFNNKKNETVSYKYLDNIKTCGCRFGMRAVNGKLIIQLEWPNIISCIAWTIYECPSEHNYISARNILVINYLRQSLANYTTSFLSH